VEVDKYKKLFYETES